MKVDPDILSIHRGLPSSEEEQDCGSPESPTGTRNLHEERRPRSFIAAVLRRLSKGLPADACVTICTAAARPWSGLNEPGDTESDDCLVCCARLGVGLSRAAG